MANKTRQPSPEKKQAIFQAAMRLCMFAGEITLAQMFGFSERMIQQWKIATMDASLLLLADPENMTQQEKEIAQQSANRYLERMEELQRLEKEISAYLSKHTELPPL